MRVSSLSRAIWDTCKHPTIRDTSTHPVSRKMKILFSCHRHRERAEVPSALDVHFLCPYPVLSQQTRLLWRVRICFLICSITNPACHSISPDASWTRGSYFRTLETQVTHLFLSNGCVCRGVNAT